MKHVIHIRVVGGEPMLDAACMSLLFGVPIADVQALPVAAGAMRIPQSWLQRGRQRSREAMAHTGHEDILEIMRYWASRDHGADLTVVFE